MGVALPHGLNAGAMRIGARIIVARNGRRVRADQAAHQALVESIAFATTAYSQRVPWSGFAFETIIVVYFVVLAALAPQRDLYF
jgi:hypothetical protein